MTVYYTALVLLPVIVLNTLGEGEGEWEGGGRDILPWNQFGFENLLLVNCNSQNSRQCSFDHIVL